MADIGRLSIIGHFAPASILMINICLDMAYAAANKPVFTIIIWRSCTITKAMAAVDVIAKARVARKLKQPPIRVLLQPAFRIATRQAKTGMKTVR
jgi:hypothetical protein